MLVIAHTVPSNLILVHILGGVGVLIRSQSFWSKRTT